MGIGFLLLWLSFRKLDLQEIWYDIRDANYYWLIVSLVFAIGSHIFRALRWNLLINSLNYKTKLSTTFFAVMIGYLANTAVPRMGEFVRCGVLSKKEKIPFNALFGTVISERIFDLITLAVIILLVIIFQLNSVGDFLNQLFGPFFNELFSNFTSVIVLTSSILIIFVALIMLIRKLKEKIKRIPFYNKIQEFMSGLFDGIKTILKLKQKWLFLLYTFIIWFFYALMVYLPLFMLEETSHLTFINGLTILAIGSLGMVAPVPGGIGAYHFIVKTVLYEIFKIGGNASGSYAVITHTGQTILNVLVGSLSYFYMGVLAKRERPLNE